MVDVLAQTALVLLCFKSHLEPYGFEVHPFLVGWYNERVELEYPDYKLNYPDNTLAYVVLTAPNMFEKLFIPFIKALSDVEFDALRNPLNSAIDQKLREVRKECTFIVKDGIDLIHASDVTNDGKLKILVQHAGNVSGAIRLYDRHDLDEDQLFETPFGKVCGAALHPRYGGWFIFREVYVFKNVKHPDLERPPRLEILGSKAEVRDFLYKSNCHGLEYIGGWRDFGKPVERYSGEQIEYSKMSREERRAFLVRLRNTKTREAQPDHHIAAMIASFSVVVLTVILFALRPLKLVLERM